MGTVASILNSPFHGTGIPCYRVNHHITEQTSNRPYKKLRHQTLTPTQQNWLFVFVKFPPSCELQPAYRQGPAFINGGSRRPSPRVIVWRKSTGWRSRIDDDILASSPALVLKQFVDLTEYLDSVHLLL